MGRLLGLALCVLILMGKTAAWAEETRPDADHAISETKEPCFEDQELSAAAHRFTEALTDRMEQETLRLPAPPARP